MADRLIAGIASARRGEDRLVHGERAAGELGQAIENEPPFRSSVEPGARLVVGDRAGIDHWVRFAILAAFDGREGVERQAGRIDAQAPARGVRAQNLQDKREHERLRYAHDREWSVPVAARVRSAADATTQRPN